jgi:hypothetical protein
MMKQMIQHQLFWSGTTTTMLRTILKRIVVIGTMIIISDRGSSSSSTTSTTTSCCVDAFQFTTSFIQSRRHYYNTLYPFTKGCDAISALQMSSSSSSSSSLQEGTNTNNNRRPDLVDQATFVSAIEYIEDQIELELIRLEELQQQQQFQPNGIDEGATTTMSNYDSNTGYSNDGETTATYDDNDVDDTTTTSPVYAMGRLFVQLPIDKQPELDLTESIGPLVLVTDIYGATAETTGIQIYDTIVKVTVDTPTTPTDPSSTTTTTTTTFSAITKYMSLEQTAAVLTAAAQHAIENGQTEITLELNRLINGYYAPQD